MSDIVLTINTNHRSNQERGTPHAFPQERQEAWKKRKDITTRVITHHYRGNNTPPIMDKLKDKQIHLFKDSNFVIVSIMTSILGRTRKPDITFYKSGKIDISKRIASILKLREGDVIDIMHDDREYYLYAKRKETLVGANRATVHHSKNSNNHFRAFSITLTNAMRTACNATGNARMCAGVPVELNNLGVAIPIIYQYTL